MVHSFVQTFLDFNRFPAQLLVHFLSQTSSFHSFPAPQPLLSRRLPSILCDNLLILLASQIYFNSSVENIQSHCVEFWVGWFLLGNFVVKLKNNPNNKTPSKIIKKKKKRKTQTVWNPVIHARFCVHVLYGWVELPASFLTNVLSVENSIIVLPSLHFMLWIV